MFQDRLGVILISKNELKALNVLLIEIPDIFWQEYGAITYWNEHGIWRDSRKKKLSCGAKSIIDKMCLNSDSVLYWDVTLNRLIYVSESLIIFVKIAIIVTFLLVWWGFNKLLEANGALNKYNTSLSLSWDLMKGLSIFIIEAYFSVKNLFRSWFMW